MGLIPTDVRGLILDMDGVLWQAESPIGDLPHIFERIRTQGLGFVFATNNGTKTPAEYQQKLADFGVIVNEAQIVTSAMAIAFILEKKFPRGAKIFMIGEEGIRAALAESGFEVLPLAAAGEAQALVMGIDRGITFEKVEAATLLVQAGIPYYTTNADRTFPTPRGEIPGSGAWNSVITTATGIEPIVAGKPFPYLMELSIARLGLTNSETLVVGDRLETDIAAGQSVGCRTALVLSGVSTREQALDGTPPPTIIVEDLGTLVE